jgi:hypothetical protein
MFGRAKLDLSPRACPTRVSSDLTHYNDHRVNQGRHQHPPNATGMPPRPVADLTAARVRRRRILNGLINEYSQVA